MHSSFFTKRFMDGGNAKWKILSKQVEWLEKDWRIRSCSWWLVRTCSTWAIMELCMASICPRSSVNSLCWLRRSINSWSWTSAFIYGTERIIEKEDKVTNELHLINSFEFNTDINRQLFANRLEIYLKAAGSVSASLTCCCPLVAKNQLKLMYFQEN